MPPAADSPPADSPFAPSYKIGFGPPTASPPSVERLALPVGAAGNSSRRATGDGTLAAPISLEERPIRTAAAEADAREAAARGKGGAAKGGGAKGAAVPLVASGRLRHDATPPLVASPDRAMATDIICDYRQLVWTDGGRSLPPGVNAAKLEAHLSDEQFAQVLGVSRQMFYAMSMVEQMRLKQDVGLF